MPLSTANTSARDFIIKATIFVVGCCRAGALALKPPSRRRMRNAMRARLCQEGQGPCGYPTTLLGRMEGLRGHSQGGLCFFETCRSGAMGSLCCWSSNRGGRRGPAGQAGWHDGDQRAGTYPTAFTVPSVHLRCIPPPSPPQESLGPALSHAPTGWAGPA